MHSVIKTVYYSDKISTENIHYHDCHQILFIKEGRIELTLDGEVYICRSGDIIILSRYVHHSIRVLTRAYRRYVIRLDPFALRGQESIKEYSLFFNRPTRSKNILSVTKNRQAFISVFDQIIAESRNSDLFSEDMSYMLVRKLLIMLYRTSPQLFVALGEEKSDMIFSLQRLLERECKENHTLEGLARKYHVSVSTLSHQFKKITGFSVFEYLLSCRIAKAKYLLSKTSMPIGQIVEECGFSDSSNFSRTFKAQIGVTPTGFRENYSLLL